MTYRLNKNILFESLKQWNHFLNRKVRLIACGGTAMTLQNIKPSTKDVDFMTPVIAEYNYLITVLKDVGYRKVSGFGWQHKKDVFQFDIFCGNHIHTTELLESPLIKKNHTPCIELSNLYVGILNDYDLIVSKLMRGTEVDFDDCLMLFEAHIGQINLNQLVEHFHEMLSYHPVGETRLRPNIETFVERLNERGLND